jgi:hypothetical protein
MQGPTLRHAPTHHVHERKAHKQGAPTWQETSRGEQSLLWSWLAQVGEQATQDAQGIEFVHHPRHNEATVLGNIKGIRPRL